MKRISIAVALTALLGLLVLGCSSPAEEAQQMFNAGQYQQLVDKFGSDPALTGVVEQAKNKLAESLFKEGKYAEVIAQYPQSPFAAQAKNKLAENLFKAGRYDELIATYPDTPAAAQARLALERARGDSLAALSGEQGKQIQQQGAKIEAQGETIEVAAQRELDRINNIKNPRLRATELEKFVNSPKFKDTAAAKKAKAAMGGSTKG